MEIDTLIKSIPSVTFFSNEFLTSSDLAVTSFAIILMVVVSSLGIYIQRKRKKKLLFRVDLLVLTLSILGIIITYDNYTEKALTQWKKDYLAPYVMTLPTERLEKETVSNLEVKELYKDVAVVEFTVNGEYQERVMQVDTLKSKDEYELGVQTMDKTVHVASFKRVQEGDYKVYTLYVPIDKASLDEPKKELKPH